MRCQIIHDNDKRCRSKKAKPYMVMLDEDLFECEPCNAVIYICDDCLKQYPNLKLYAEEVKQ